MKSIRPDKREAILTAMLDVVVERGFHDAPMSVIAQRAGASAGVIYHHFAGKDEIIAALYERIAAQKRASLLAGYSEALDVATAFRMVWRNEYHFCRQHVKEMRFLEMYEAAGFDCGHAEEPKDKTVAAFKRHFRSQTRGGVLNDWPEQVHYEMTFGLVTRLARLERKLTDRQLDEIGLAIWESIRA